MDRPSRQRIVVVLPAPLGPKAENLLRLLPGRPRSACTGPCVLVSPLFQWPVVSILRPSICLIS